MQPSSASSTDTRPRVLGIHHLKLAVSSLPISLAWYTRVLGAQRLPSLDHISSTGERFAVICQMPDWSNLLLELRENASRARMDRGWDPLTLVVGRRQDLVVWASWLDRCGTVRSPLLVGMRGWLLVFEDPDGRRIRIYTREDHGGRETASVNPEWLDGA